LPEIAAPSAVQLDWVQIFRLVALFCAVLFWKTTVITQFVVPRGIVEGAVGESEVPSKDNVVGIEPRFAWYLWPSVSVDKFAALVTSTDPPFTTTGESEGPKRMRLGPGRIWFRINQIPARVDAIPAPIVRGINAAMTALRNISESSVDRSFEGMNR